MIENSDRKFLEEKNNGISDEDKYKLKVYVSNKRSIKKTAAQLNINPDTFKSWVFKKLNGIGMELNHKNGMLGSWSLFNDHQKKNIKNFVKKFRYCLENNCLESMRIYFGKRFSASCFDFIKIKEIIKIDPLKLARNKYRITVSYLDHNKKFNSFALSLQFSRRNSVRVIDLPKPPQRILMYNIADIPNSVHEQLKPGKRGIIELSDKEVNELLKDIPKEIIFNKKLQSWNATKRM